MLFNKIVYYSLLIGVLVGIVITILQFWQVIPIIQSAEAFENQSKLVIQQDNTDHQSHTHEHSADSWSPNDGFERTGYTLLSNILTVAGFAMIMLGIMMVLHKNKISFSWKYALTYGSAGYFIFFLAPALGVPPEIPLTMAAPIEDRQLWWLLSVVCSSIGLAGLAFGKTPWRWIMPILIVVPYIVGAPHISGTMFANQTPVIAIELEKLSQQFISATAIVNAVLWFLLGIGSVWAVQRVKSFESGTTCKKNI